MAQLHETLLGRTLIEHTLPDIGKQLKKIADSLSKLDEKNTQLAATKQPQPTANRFWAGSICIQSENIDALREMVDDLLSAVAPENELPGYITDLFFSIELAYQQQHNLGPDDYSFYKKS